MSFLCNSFTNKVASLQSIEKFTEIKVFGKDIFQQTFVGLQRRLEDVFIVAIYHFSGHRENILENEILL